MMIKYYSRLEINREIWKHIKQVDFVLDIGSGIRPQGFVKPMYHICCEPYEEYINKLNILSKKNTSIITMQETAQSAIEQFDKGSVDSIFMLDVIEHMVKTEAKEVIDQCVKVARNQVVIYTPLGMREQQYEDGELDPWGMHGGRWQTHKSAWYPNDFINGWDILVSPEYSYVDCKGRIYDKPMGVFWAIHNNSNNGEIVKRPLLSYLQIVDRIISGVRILNHFPAPLSTSIVKSGIKMWATIDRLTR